MIVRKLESPLFFTKDRRALPGRGAELQRPRQLSFEQCLREAFEGRTVLQGNVFSGTSPMMRDNLIRLGGGK